MKLRQILPVIIFLLMASLQAGEVIPLPVEIKADNPAIQYMGRISDDYRGAWTGTGLKFKFTGTAAQAKIEGRKSAIQVVVDGKPGEIIMLEQGKKVYDLASGLTDGEHVIELFRRVEGYFPEAKYLGLRLSEGGKLIAIEPAKRKIMVIGDSITCGYANEATDLNTGNNEKNENGYMSYAPIAARALDADIMMICWSGRGLYRNRDKKNDLDNTIPKMFDRTLPMNSDIKWDHQKFIPDVIAINLGTNDNENYKGGKPVLEKDKFLGAYREFIGRLHTLYPKAQIIVSIGPMGGKNIAEWLTDLDKEYDYVHKLVYNNPKGKEWLGGHWHPSVKLDEYMGEALTKKVKEITGW